MPSGIEPGILLKIGGSVGPPPSTAKWLFVDSDGLLKTVDSTGAITPYGQANFNRLAVKTPLLTDADVTIDPTADKCSLYILPAATLTQARTLTIANAAQTSTTQVSILRLDQSANDYTIRNSTPTTLYNGTGSPASLKKYTLYFTAGAWIANFIEYVQVT